MASLLYPLGVLPRSCSQLASWQAGGLLRPAPKFARVSGLDLAWPEPKFAWVQGTLLTLGPCRRGCTAQRGHYGVTKALKVVLCGMLLGGPPSRERGRRVLVRWAPHAVVLLRRRHLWCQSSGAGVLLCTFRSAHLLLLGASSTFAGGGSFGSHGGP